VGPTGNDVITEIPDWPVIGVSVDGGRLERPAILEIL
jgi:hypothetical protein